ncbi:MAG: hypothetical protein SGJ27_17265 [Candidatus Melainabacteria bacterium]|nr:hypothetical protein [Candidatus Melainabacteria bacterium]
MVERAGDAGNKASTEHDKAVITTDSLDSFRLALTRDDFTNIDTDENNRLSATELRTSSESGSLSANKQTAVDGFLSFLDKQPVNTLDDDREVRRVIPSWQTADFAASRMSSLDFGTLDKDGDKVLSKGELTSGKDNIDVTSSGKFAAELFLNLLDGNVTDARGIVRRDTVNDFTKLDPRFKNKTEAQLDQLSMEGTATEKVRALDENITRNDYRFDSRDVEESVKSTILLQKALKENRDLDEGADGKPELGNTPLTEQRRLLFHNAIAKDLNTIGAQVVRNVYKTELLESTGQHEAAIKAGEEAVKSADGLTKSYSGDGWKTTIAELVKTERDLLQKDSGSMRLEDRSKTEDQKIRANMSATADQLNRMLSLPATTRAGLARQLLGFQLDEFQLGKGVKFDTNSSMFNPKRAEELHSEGKKYITENFEITPSEFSGHNVTSLFGGAWKVIDPKSQYNFYQDRNNNGKSDLIERIKGLK